MGKPVDGTSVPAMPVVEYHKWLKDDTIKIKLMKMSKSYQWEITYENENTDAVIERLKQADLKLRVIYNEEDK